MFLENNNNSNVTYLYTDILSHWRVRLISFHSKYFHEWNEWKTKITNQFLKSKLRYKSREKTRELARVFLFRVENIHSIHKQILLFALYLVILDMMTWLQNIYTISKLYLIFFIIFLGHQILHLRYFAAFCTWNSTF